MNDQIEDCIERNSDEVAHELIRQEFLDLFDKAKWRTYFKPDPMQDIVCIDSIAGTDQPQPPTKSQWQEATRIAERLIDLSKKYNMPVLMNSRTSVDPEWFGADCEAAHSIARKLIADKLT